MRVAALTGQRPQTSLMFLAMVLILASFCISLSQAYTMVIPRRGQECFYEELKVKDRLITTFEVMAGGMLDINVRVVDPQGDVVYEQEREKEGIFQFRALQQGSYMICFSNAMSTMTSKTISFNIYTGNGLHRFQNANAGHLQPLDAIVSELNDNVNGLRDAYSYLRTRLMTSALTAESSLSRVWIWGLVNIALALAALVLRTVFIVRPFQTARTFSGSGSSASNAMGRSSLASQGFSSRFVGGI